MKGYKAARARTFSTKLTGVLGETDCERRFANFLLEEILFVQKQDNGGIGEPFVVANRVEQL